MHEKSVEERDLREPVNRAERRAARKLHPNYRYARLTSRPFRRAFGGWAGAFRPGHGSRS